MTPDERKMLTELAAKIAQTPAPPRDAEAEELIRTRIGNRPDALYLMTQTVLIQNMALQQAQRQMAELQQRGPAGSGSGSFLGQGGPSSNVGSSQPQYGQPNYQPPSYAQQPAYAQPQAMPNSGGAPSFLRGAATTAAGVAAGALAFEGIRSMFSHPGYGMGSEGFGGFGGGGFGRPEETIVNNYYDSPGSTEHGSDDLRLGDNRDQDNFADTGSLADDSNVTDVSDDDSYSNDLGSGDSSDDFS